MNDNIHSEDMQEIYEELLAYLNKHFRYLKRSDASAYIDEALTQIAGDIEFLQEQEQDDVYSV